MNTEFGRLKEIVVGVELELEERVMDFTFKNMYRDNLGLSNIYDCTIDKYKINKRYINERISDLNMLAEQLQSHNIEVHRPDKVKVLDTIKTPTYKTVTSSASNVRDITLVHNNCIIETPLLVRNRTFENLAMQSIFTKKMQEGVGWIRAPHTNLTSNSIDTNDWKNQRNFGEIPKKHEMGIDAAHCLKIGVDVICNVATYNHYLGFLWLKRINPGVNYHMVKICDSHIDGTLMVLRPGVFMVNDFKYTTAHIRNELPEKFKSWDIIKIGDESKEPYKDEDDLYSKINNELKYNLASSRGMDVNVLSIDERKVMCLDKANKTMDILDKNGFEPIPIKLRHGEIFAGGIHCSTLDLKRDDELIDYTV